MLYKDLKLALRHEFKLKTGQYLRLSMEDFATTLTDIVIDVDFCLNHKTMMFCTRTVSEDKQSLYTVNKIVTITRTGDVFQFNFKPIEMFIEYVKKHDLVESIEKF